MFSRSMNRRAVLLALVPALVLIGAGVVYAADIVIHGKVLSVQPLTRTFRIRVQETGKEATIFTFPSTVFRFPNNKQANFSDVKVGKTVEIRGQVRSADAYNASVVTIRL